MKKHYINEYTQDYLQSKEKPRVTENRNIAWWLNKLSQRIEAGFVLFLIVFVFGLFAYLLKNNKALNLFPLTEIQLVGKNSFTTQEDVEQVLKEAIPKSMLDAKTEEIKSAILSLPWVVEVSVSKHWPGILKVSVEEKTPIMRWGESQVVDADGNVFKSGSDADLHEKLLNKPMLKGPKDKAKLILEQFDSFTNVFPEYREIGLRTFELTEHEAWELELDNGARIKFGKNFFIPRAKRLAYAYRARLLPDVADLDVVYMTYNQGFSVLLKDEKLKGENANPELLSVKLESI